MVPSLSLEGENRAKVLIFRPEDRELGLYEILHDKSQVGTVGLSWDLPASSLNRRCPRWDPGPQGMNKNLKIAQLKAGALVPGWSHVHCLVLTLQDIRSS
jgi:hypothetical protein